MKLPKIKDYPKKLLIGEEYYAIRFVKSLENSDEVGECCPQDRVIRIKRKIGRQDTFKTFIHEVIHAFEFEYELKISHALVYQLEEAIYSFLIENT